ncbi:alkaline phosphatase family protein [Burkholderia plantarii]|uniref:alkaline phosphatase family protein n=1 Tax=Burkholderia plantarii TaxID=41899 RepID=UPI0018DE4E7F|nr:alkaline phosphatase family protein [Burkholderia plantarii]MBI0328603.1 phosphoesterase [Burkholderia plantarii]
MANQLGNIKHIVQLMLENRSFDQMLGLLYDGQRRTPSGAAFDGLTGDESNPDETGRDIPVSKITATTPDAYFRPGADPGEGYYNTNEQLFSNQHPAPGAVPDNRGFVLNFKSAIDYDLAHHYGDSLPGTLPADIMQMYTPEMLPVISALARGFAVCDAWYASAPTQTVPNRAFAGAGTSQGRLDNHVKSFTCPSIYGRLSDGKLDWAIFGYNRPPLTRTDFPDTLHADASHFGLFSDFKRLAAAGRLPAYTFLEPDFSASGNSQHPNYDVAKGEQLIHDVYRALRDGPGWNDTLLLITYDEHGGNYDHVAPPADAVAPDDSVGEFDNFDFKRFGVRIPAVLISPLIAAGTVFRAQDGTIDHTSVLKTIGTRWNLPPLTRRDAAAPGLGDVLTLAEPRQDDPLAGILPPQSQTSQPNRATPSSIERLHAWRVSKLPIPDENGRVDHVQPRLDTSAEMGEYIRDRMAAWDQHLSRIKR